MNRDREVSLVETKTPVESEEERIQKKAVDDIQHKVNELTGMKRELKSWERRQDTCSVDYSDQIEQLESEIEELEAEVEEIENKYL